MLTAELRLKLSKVYELVKRGATEGERNAAQRVLDGLIEKYNLTGINLDDLDKPIRKFKYSSMLEMYLFQAIVRYFINEDILKDAKRYLYKEKAIGLPLTHIDYITVDCSYEYFRRHMRKEWQKNCEPLLRKCRKANTRNKRRKELQELFISRYIIASKLCKEDELTTVDLSDMSEKELEDRMKLAAVEGGAYNVQVQSAHMLNEATEKLSV